MRERWRSFLPPALLFCALFAIAAGAGYFTAGEDAGARTDAATSPMTGTRGTIQSITGNSLTLLSDGATRQFSLADDMKVEVLKPTTASTISVGEWLNAGTIPHNQTLFVIIGLNLIPPTLVQSR
jgi:hypothetical protein